MNQNASRDCANKGLNIMAESGRAAIRVSIDCGEMFTATTFETPKQYAQAIKAQNEAAGRQFDFAESDDGDIVKWRMTYPNADHTATGEIHVLRFLYEYGDEALDKRRKYRKKYLARKERLAKGRPKIS